MDVLYHGGIVRLSRALRRRGKGCAFLTFVCFVPSLENVVILTTSFASNGLPGVGVTSLKPTLPELGHCHGLGVGAQIMQRNAAGTISGIRRPLAGKSHGGLLPLA
jgi:hypothetical protein